MKRKMTTNPMNPQMNHRHDSRYVSIRYAVVWMVLMLLIAPLMGASQQETIPPTAEQGTTETPTPASDEALVVRTVGLLDTDGSVLYSIVLASGPETALGNLTLTGAVPENATLIEDVAAPPAANFTLQEEPRAVWRVEKLEADTILGPLTYRVKPKDQMASLPTSLDATVSWTDPDTGTVEVKGDTSPIQLLGESGSITIDPNGTNGLALVGDTGILIDVPAGAVQEPTTLTFTRFSVENNENLPKARDIPEAQDISWCTLVSMTSNPAVKFTQPITLVAPTYPTLTPGLLAESFIRLADGSVKNLSGQGVDYISLDGNHVVVSQVLVEEFQDLVLAIGVDANGRKQSTVNGSQLQSIFPGLTVIDWFRQSHQ